MFGPPVQGRGAVVLLLLEAVWVGGSAAAAMAGSFALPFFCVGGAVVVSFAVWLKRSQLRRSWPPFGRDEMGPAVSRRTLWRLHGWVLVVALLLLEAFSLPGFGLYSMVLAVLLLFVVGLWWLVLLGRSTRRRARLRPLLVAPALGAIVLALIAVGAPTDARWALSRHAFEEQADRLMALPADADVDVPEWVGLYHLLGARRVPQGVIFDEYNGALFDDAGFAYLPDGPDPSLENGAFESPEFTHLPGPWYAWIASW